MIDYNLERVKRLREIAEETKELESRVNATTMVVDDIHRCGVQNLGDLVAFVDESGKVRLETEQETQARKNKEFLDGLFPAQTIGRYMMDNITSLPDEVFLYEGSLTLKLR